jgi:hypothetical protein
MAQRLILACIGMSACTTLVLEIFFVSTGIGSAKATPVVDQQNIISLGDVFAAGADCVNGMAEGAPQTAAPLRCGRLGLDRICAAWG